MTENTRKTLEDVCRDLDQLAMSLDFMANGVDHSGARWLLIQQSNLTCQLEDTLKALLNAEAQP